MRMTTGTGTNRNTLLRRKIKTTQGQMNMLTETTLEGLRMKETTTEIEFPTRRPTDTTNNGIFPSDTGKD